VHVELLLLEMLVGYTKFAVESISGELFNLEKAFILALKDEDECKS
jgi:hypothetical protein